MHGWLESGVLVLGGPFLDDGGGGTAVVRFGTLEEADAAAQADRAVQDGLLTATTRPWLVGMTALDLTDLTPAPHPPPHS